MNEPKFATEAEEVQWLSDHRERMGEEFANAMREGKTTRLTNEKLIARIESSKSINIRLPEGDLQLARDLAASKGVPYETFIESLLHDALRREARL